MSVYDFCLYLFYIKDILDLSKHCLNLRHPRPDTNYGDSDSNHSHPDGKTRNLLGRPVRKLFIGVLLTYLDGTVSQ